MTSRHPRRRPPIIARRDHVTHVNRESIGQVKLSPAEHAMSFGASQYVVISFWLVSESTMTITQGRGRAVGTCSGRRQHEHPVRARCRVRRADRAAEASRTRSEVSNLQECGSLLRNIRDLCDARVAVRASTRATETRSGFRRRNFEKFPRKKQRRNETSASFTVVQWPRLARTSRGGDHCRRREATAGRAAHGGRRKRRPVAVSSPT